MAIMRTQKPTKPSNWLYTENADGSRNFSQFVVLGKEAEEWEECTEEEKEEKEEKDRFMREEYKKPKK